MSAELLVFILFLIKSCISGTFYVDPSATGNNWGTSWDDAYIKLELALTRAFSTGDEIWLAGGHTYIPNNAQGRDDCFTTNPGIIISGGFNGETNKNRRDPSTAASIISGDIGVIGDNSDNCYHVITYEETLTLDRVTIQDGNANFNPYAYQSQDNVLHRYGGALITYSVGKPTDLTLNEVTIRNNTALNGAALWLVSNPINTVAATIRNSVFEYNHAIEGYYEGGYGAVIYECHLANVSIFNSQFNYNKADFRGGVIYQDYGALLYVDTCQFTGNQANGWGGAIFSEDRNSQTEGTFPIISDCTFTENSAGIAGGAIFWYNHVEGTLRENTFIDNKAVVKGAAIALVDSKGELKNYTNTYIGNQIAGGLADDDAYTEPEFLFENVDESLTYDIAAELAELYTVYEGLTAEEIDFYPEDDQDDELCFVDISNQNSNQNGNSWSTAYNDLQQCFDQLMTSGGEIWVAQGTYIPPSSSVPEWKVRANKDTGLARSFIMYNNTHMYGGFVGTELNRDKRNWRDNPTYLSCQMDRRRQCNQIINSADNTLIDGFIFENAGTGVSGGRRRRLKNSLDVGAVMSATPGSSGAGIYSNSTTVTVVNTIFHKLFADAKGAALYCVGLQGETNITKSPKFVNVAFLGNRANARGGAISADLYCHFECIKCKFDNNACAKKGGAIYLDFDSDPVFVDTVFSNNYAVESGGCIAADGKSFVDFNGTATFTGNHATMEGGCLYSGSGVDKGIKQGYAFNDGLPVFEGNYLDNEEAIGYPDFYGWQYSDFDVESTITTTARPSVMPTPGPTSDAVHDRPNVIVFMVDDMQFNQLWIDSAPPGTELVNQTITYWDFPMPNFEQFRKESVVFLNAYAGAPKCTPSRYAALTGRQPTRSEWAVKRTLQTCSGFLGTNATIQTSKITYNDSRYNIMYALQNAGRNRYYTGMVGKWHVMASADGDIAENVACSDLDKGQNATLYQICTDIVKKSGFDYVDGYIAGNIGENPYYSHNPEWMVSESQKIIQNAQDEGRPFFLYFAHTLTHSPSIETAIFDFTRADTPKGKLLGNKNPSDTFMANRADIWAKALSHGESPRTEAYASHYWLDDSFGALIMYLKVNNLYDNTFIVLMNDHGMGAKGTMYQTGSRIIMAARYPPLFGDNGPYIIPKDFTVASTDLAPTIFEVAGITPPDGYVLDGKSWLSDVIDYIDNPTPSPTQKCCKYRHLDIRNSHSIVTDQYQYIFRANPNTVEKDNGVDKKYPNTYDMEQLYDLDIDPNQRINQINNHLYLRPIINFRSKMQDYLQDICPLGYGNCFQPEGETECDNDSPFVVSYQKKWTRVRSFTEEEKGATFLADATEDFYDENSMCANSMDELKVAYKYTYISNKRRLTLNMLVCCGPDKSFASDYSLPRDYVFHTGATGAFNDDVLDDVSGGNSWLFVLYCILMFLVCLSLIGIIYCCMEKCDKKNKEHNLANILSKTRAALPVSTRNVLGNNNGIEIRTRERAPSTSCADHSSTAGTNNTLGITREHSYESSRGSSAGRHVQNIHHGVQLVPMHRKPSCSLESNHSNESIHAQQMPPGPPQTRRQVSLSVPGTEPVQVQVHPNPSQPSRPSVVIIQRVPSSQLQATNQVDTRTASHDSENVVVAQPQVNDDNPTPDQSSSLDHDEASNPTEV